MSGKTTNTVKINGVLYDASTGLPLKTPSTKTKKSAQAKTSSRGHTIRRKPSRSTTLNRRAVAKKSTTKTSTVKTTKQKPSSPSKPIAKSSPKPTVKSSPKPSNPTKPSPKTRTSNVRPFGAEVTAVRPAKHALVTHLPVSHIKTRSTIVAKPSTPVKTLTPKKPTATPKPLSNPEQTPQILQNEDDPVINKLDDLLEKLDQEPSPTQTSDKQDFQMTAPRKRLKLTIISLVTTITLAAVSILIFINFHNIQLFFASSRTGVNGQIPPYSVSGYKLSEVSTSENSTIKITYTHNTKDKTYTILESQTTQENSSVDFQPDHDYATFVLNGVLYTIDHSNITNAQVNRIVDSLTE